MRPIKSTSALKLSKSQPATKSSLTAALLIVLSLTSLCAESAAPTNQPFEQVYLSHWFSIDSTEPISLTLSPLDKDHLGERSELRFTSDDGQLVNGIVARPTASKASSKKLALVLHPMGSDQQFWWHKHSPLSAKTITDSLREHGYTIISLDARKHGERTQKGFSPRELIKRAHSAEPRLYNDTIIGSVRDYRIALNWARNEFNIDDVIVLGYSMGAQMSLLLSRYEASINSIVAMVPPYVGSPTSPVAPRIHTPKIANAKLLWLAASKDPHSTKQQTQATFDLVSSDDKALVWYDSGHRLPLRFLDTVLAFIASLQKEA